jgi:neuronal guanine nucleotide exchange factor
VVTFVRCYELVCVVVFFVGWYHGERIRDGERGWFPGNYTSEVASAHVRARNLKQRYRLLALSGNFLEAQRKEKQAK